jgi:hypothetical protein
VPRLLRPNLPGEILADTVLRANGGISVTEFAKKLKMTRAAVTTAGGLDEWSFASYLNSTQRGSTKRPPATNFKKTIIYQSLISDMIWTYGVVQRHWCSPFERTLSNLPSRIDTAYGTS